MVVPALVLGEHLHETNAPFDQPPGNQAALAEFTARRIIQAVHLLRRRRLPAQVECLECRRLHLGSQGVRRDACLQVGLADMPLQVPLIELPHHVEVALLRSTTQPSRRSQIENSRLAGPHHRSLIERWQIPVRPVFDTKHRQLSRIDQRHVRRQLVCFAAQPKRQPAPQHWSSGQDPATLQCSNRLPVVIDTRLGRTNQTDVVRDFTQMRQQLGEFHAALAVSAKLPRGAEDFRGSLSRIVVLHLAGIRLPVVLLQLRLGIEQIEVTRASLHPERNHGSRSRPKVGLLRREVIPGNHFRTLRRRIAPCLVAVQQPCERHWEDPHRLRRQEMTSRPAPVEPFSTFPTHTCILTSRHRRDDIAPACHSTYRNSLELKTA